VRRFDFDAHLAPYNLGQWQQWQQLSCHVTPDVLSKLLPVGRPRPAASPAAAAAAALQQHLQQQLQPASRMVQPA
jgi:2-oxoglutarate dehydrogenase complex dehydrogenase (E1) component-like enzyme